MAALAAPRPKCEQRALKKFDETSSSDSESSDSDAIVHEDSSKSKVDETADSFQESTSFSQSASLYSRAKRRNQQLAVIHHIVDDGSTGDV